MTLAILCDSVQYKGHKTGGQVGGQLTVLQTSSDMSGFQEICCLELPVIKGRIGPGPDTLERLANQRGHFQGHSLKGRQRKAQL